MDNLSRFFQLEIITPERIFFQGKAQMVEFTTEDGMIGVYKDHIPMTTVLAPGIVTIISGLEKKKASLMAGFAEILPDRVRILAEVAEWPEDIDKNRAEAAKERAEKRLKDRSKSAVDAGRAEFALRKALLRLNMSER